MRLLQINVNGSHAEPLWVYLKKEQHGFLIDAIKWNFTKFLINKEGCFIIWNRAQMDLHFYTSLLLSLLLLRISSKFGSGHAFQLMISCLIE